MTLDAGAPGVEICSVCFSVLSSRVPLASPKPALHAAPGAGAQSQPQQQSTQQTLAAPTQKRVRMLSMVYSPATVAAATASQPASSSSPPHQQHAQQQQQQQNTAPISAAATVSINPSGTGELSSPPESPDPAVAAAAAASDDGKCHGTMGERNACHGRNACNTNVLLVLNRWRASIRRRRVHGVWRSSSRHAAVESTRTAKSHGLATRLLLVIDLSPGTSRFGLPVCLVFRCSLFEMIRAACLWNCPIARESYYSQPIALSLKAKSTRARATYRSGYQTRYCSKRKSTLDSTRTPRFL